MIFYGFFMAIIKLDREYSYEEAMFRLAQIIREKNPGIFRSRQ